MEHHLGELRELQAACASIRTEIEACEDKDPDCDVLVLHEELIQLEVETDEMTDLFGHLQAMFDYSGCRDDGPASERRFWSFLNKTETVAG